MIVFENSTFYLQTHRTSYWFKITEHGHLEHVYYGTTLPPQPTGALELKRTANRGSTIAYAKNDSLYSLDRIPLEYSGIGQGDYRESPLELIMPDGTFTTDFVYVDQKTVQGTLPGMSLPVAHAGAAEALTLIVIMKDRLHDVSMELIYTVFPECDVITRRVRLLNGSDSPVIIRKLASMMIDMPNRQYQLMTLDGDWSKETHAHVRPLQEGTVSIGSTTGASSNRHNPGVLLIGARTTQTTGPAYASNLVYSGNHRTAVELDSFGTLRLMSGIHPQGFSWPLASQEIFESPEAVLSFSDKGLNGVSQQMHQFVRDHIQPQRYHNQNRPIVYNSWEATFFDFTSKSQLKLAKQAQKLGIELFVVDDGWFVGRNDDTAGLGNYTVDKAKFPGGLGTFATQINNMGMKFGLWFEPEMVNADSDLWREHPDWALQIPGREPKTGRNQYVLDLCNPQVCDFIVDSVGRTLDSATIDYVKWDMNRHISDVFSHSVPDQGMVYHRYICNLYEVLRRIFEPRPHVLLEMCSSGGNRFDLGMLSFAAMIWSSDDTDPIERLEIQQGLSYLYPLCAISAHVSNSPHQQTLRATPLSTRFNVASFGTLGYEYDLTLLNREEKEEIKGQIAFYKRHRSLFQFGRFSRHDHQRDDLFQWQVGHGDRAIVGNFQRHIGAAPGDDYLAVLDLDPDKTFSLTSQPQRLMIERFGALVHHVLPVKLDPRGTILSTVNKYYSMRDAAEEYTGSGALLAQGIFLQNQFIATQYNAETRLLGDYGSTLYIAKTQED